MKTRRIDYSQGAIQTDEARVKADELGIDRAVYAKISNLTDNKTLIRPDDRDSNFNRWLLDMNHFNDTGEATQQIKDLDTYFSTLGVTEDYPYKDDTYDVEPWIEITDQDPIRNVVHQGDNVVYFDGTTTYNVIHTTGT